jgi:two-component system CitB family response regulator
MTFAVLVVDDDFRVARLHARFVAEVPGYRVVGEAHSAREAREAAERETPDLVLLDNYLPDQLGVELARGLPCDVLLVTADSSPATVRAAVAAGAVSVLVKPFRAEDLGTHLAAYARYRRALPAGVPELGQEGVDRALAALRPVVRPPVPKGQSPVTARLVAEQLRSSPEPLTATDVADALGISRATAQRYLATLAENRQAGVAMRYGTTGRPEHLYRWLIEGGQAPPT